MARTGRPRAFDRDDAVSKAMNLFWEKGFESTSLADLRETLGKMSSASFYAAFGSKQALYKECLERYVQSCGAASSVLDDNLMSPRECMQTMLYDTISMQTSPLSPSGCMAVLSGLNCLDENKEVEALTRQVRKDTRDAIQRCVIRGFEQGQLPQTMNVEAYTLMLDCFVKGISLQARDGLSGQVLKEAADQLLDCWSC
ncbi:TetR/AcrR family transcriptional regulator [Oceanobacter mangrovi]|uniref:TetR/AcrR family transcriptional regulator n=1 Tax=Oceanobacter mangrovi TaxID=2862510 RepID=UPI001C8E17E8|nr:TetR/AcrR family transcriptional regulator [Oceanobacter mangrovi]